MDTPAQTTINSEEMQKAYEQLMKRRAYSAEYMRKFRKERREEYNAQRRAMYARKKNSNNENEITNNENEKTNNENEKTNNENEKTSE